MATTTKTLTMTFGLDNGKSKTYNLPDPKSDLDAAKVQVFMGEVVSTSAVKVNGAVADEMKTAYIKEVTTTSLF